MDPIQKLQRKQHRSLQPWNDAHLCMLIDAIIQQYQCSTIILQKFVFYSSEIYTFGLNIVGIK